MNLHTPVTPPNPLWVYVVNLLVLRLQSSLSFRQAKPLLLLPLYHKSPSSYVVRSVLSFLVVLRPWSDIVPPT